jgi:heme-degrading monooxygenase HmoA
MLLCQRPLVVEGMMLLRNKVKIKELSQIAMQRELRILEKMRGIKEIKVVRHRHLMIVLILWEWLNIQ